MKLLLCVPMLHVLFGLCSMMKFGGKEGVRNGRPKATLDALHLRVFACGSEVTLHSGVNVFDCTMNSVRVCIDLS